MSRMRLAVLPVLTLLFGCAENSTPVSPDVSTALVAQSNQGSVGLTAVGRTVLTQYGEMYQYSMTTRYDRQGREIEVSGDGYRISTIYNSHGVIIEHTIDSSSPTERSIQTLITTAFDRRGNPIRQSLVWDFQERTYNRGDNEIAYDSRGNAVETTWHWTRDIVGVSVVTRVYDNHGNVLKRVIDFYSETFRQRETGVYSYDAQGAVIGYTVEYDNYVDGVIDYTDTFSTLEFDPHGNPVRQVLDYRFYGYRVTTTLGPYDTHHNPLRVIEDWDESFDGTIEYHYDTTYEYTGSGYGRKGHGAAATAAHLTTAPSRSRGVHGPKRGIAELRSLANRGPNAAFGQ